MKSALQFLVLFFLNSIICQAQNLISNGDFETNTGFPTGFQQYYLATGWNNCGGVNGPNYAHNSGSGPAALPNNYSGTVTPHGGNAVMGLLLWYDQSPATEYISHPLSSAMVIGHTYRISFYISNGGLPRNEGGYGIDQVSIALSTIPLFQPWIDNIGFTPVYVVPGIFFDSTWQQVSFMFTADSAYTQLTFGNFKPNSNTNAQQFQIGGYQDAYYFVDDFEVIDMSPSVSFSCSDTTFCDKQYINFYDLSTNTPTSWQWLFPGGSPSSSTQQNPVGIYYNSYGSFDVTLIACNAAGCDTLFLPGFINEFQSPQVPVVTWVADTLFSTPAFSYQWYFNSSIIPGATGQYYVFQQPGDYFVIVTDSNGCSTPSTVLYTGIDEAVSNGGICVIPNPTDGDFVLYGAKVNSVVKIYDVEGRVLYFGKVTALKEKIHFEGANGVYFVEVIEGATYFRRKIILKN